MYTDDRKLGKVGFQVKCQDLKNSLAQILVLILISQHSHTQYLLISANSLWYAQSKGMFQP